MRRAIILVTAAITLLFSCHKKSYDPRGYIKNMPGTRIWTGWEKDQNTFMPFDTAFNLALPINITSTTGTTITTSVNDTSVFTSYQPHTLSYAYATEALHTMTFVYAMHGIDSYIDDTIVYNYIDNTMTQHQKTGGMTGIYEIMLHTP